MYKPTLYGLYEIWLLILRVQFKNVMKVIVKDIPETMFTKRIRFKITFTVYLIITGQ